MPEPVPSPEPTEPVNPNVCFERTDVNVRAIAVCAGVVVVTTVIVHLVFLSTVGSRTGGGQPQGPVPAPVSQDRVRLPRDLKKVPAPRLQVDATRDLIELRQRDQDLLDHYAWVDVKGQVVRIPIDRAMQLLSDPKTAAAHGIRVKAEGK